jgi:hypoxanthine phosphoribosyltransferase
VKAGLRTLYSSKQLAKRVAALGRDVSRDYADKTVDVVVILENAFFFAADLVRELSCRVVCHFVSAEVRDIRFEGHDRREVYFGRAPRLKDRDVLLVDAVIQSGVTHDFLIKRLQESEPKSLRLIVLFDKPQGRKTDIKPDYFGFSAASKYLAGYGLLGSRRWYRNLPYVGVQQGRAGVRASRRRSVRVRGVR